MSHTQMQVAITICFHPNLFSQLALGILKENICGCTFEKVLMVQFYCALIVNAFALGEFLACWLPELEKLPNHKCPQTLGPQEALNYGTFTHVLMGMTSFLPNILRGFYP